MRTALTLLLICVSLSAQVIPSARRIATPTPSTSSSSTLNTGITTYWKLDETSGTRVDSGTNGQDLGDVNTVTSNTGVIGNAGQFTASTTEYLNHADSATLSTGDIDYTFVAWVYFDTKTADRSILAKYGSGGQREYRLQYISAVDRFRWRVTTDGLNGVQADANTFGSPSTATWYFIVAYRDTVNNLIGISVNNGTFDTVANTGASVDGTTQFTLGSDNGGSVWDGRIDEVGFWKRMLTADEITELYNSGAGKTCCPF